MMQAEVDSLCARIASLGPAAGDPELRAVLAALLIEDAFDIILTDEEITPAALGDAESIKQVLSGHGVCG